MSPAVYIFFIVLLLLQPGTYSRKSSTRSSEPHLFERKSANDPKINKSSAGKQIAFNHKTFDEEVCLYAYLSFMKCNHPFLCLPIFSPESKTIPTVSKSNLIFESCSKSTSLPRYIKIAIKMDMNLNSKLTI